MPCPDPIPSRYQRRAAEVQQLRSAIDAAAQGARSACEGRPDLAESIYPLLVRLEEIREELDRIGSAFPQPISGELYPFWINLARLPRR